LTKRALAREARRNPIQVARDCEQALNFIDRWDEGDLPPVFILLDLKLPKVSGLEVLRRVKGYPKFSSIPVIIMSTSAEDRDIEKAYKLGCNSYIVKPIEFDKFVEVASQVEAYWRQCGSGPRQYEVFVNRFHSLINDLATHL
jgi:CheY-like chemotaxis protein